MTDIYVCGIATDVCVGNNNNEDFFCLVLYSTLVSLCSINSVPWDRAGFPNHPCRRCQPWDQGSTQSIGKRQLQYFSSYTNLFLQEDDITKAFEKIREQHGAVVNSKEVRLEIKIDQSLEIN